MRLLFALLSFGIFSIISSASRLPRAANVHDLQSLRAFSNPSLAGSNASTSTVQLTAATSLPASESLGFGGLSVYEGTLSKTFTIYDAASSIAQAVCSLPSMTPNAATPGVALGVHKPCRRRTYQYAFLSFNSPSNFILGISHT